MSKEQLITNNWNLTDKLLKKEFLFKGFLSTMNFANAVAFIANKNNHHPKMIINFKSCVVELTTHDAGNKITQKDFDLAMQIEELYKTP